MPPGTCSRGFRGIRSALQEKREPPASHSFRYRRRQRFAGEYSNMEHRHRGRHKYGTPAPGGFGRRRAASCSACPTGSRAGMTGAQDPRLHPISCDQCRAEQAVEVFLANLRLAKRQQHGEPGTDSGLGRDEARSRKKSNIEHRHRFPKKVKYRTPAPVPGRFSTGTGSCGHRFLTGRRSGSRRQAGQGAAEANPLPGILVDAAVRETAPQTP